MPDQESEHTSFLGHKCDRPGSNSACDDRPVDVDGRVAHYSWKADPLPTADQGGANNVLDAGRKLDTAIAFHRAYPMF
ncbi:hypothetical protein FQN55_004387 [Onygenales sp. PD_40]|nr:hypothetical protein FQN55_004387 [Onygenales sp. PD_40]